MQKPEQEPESESEPELEPEPDPDPEPEPEPEPEPVAGFVTQNKTTSSNTEGGTTAIPIPATSIAPGKQTSKAKGTVSRKRSVTFASTSQKKAKLTQGRKSSNPTEEGNKAAAISFSAGILSSKKTYNMRPVSLIRL